MTTEKTDQFASRSKTSAKYWLEGRRLFNFARKNDKGTLASDADYSFQVHFAGRRAQFQLHTAIKAEAASKAATIYRDIIGRGWEEALRIHKPKAEIKSEMIPPATVGKLIAACMRLSNARRESLEAYAKALRRIAAGVFEITDGKKFDAFKGGRADWLEKIDSKPLAEISPAAVLAWRNKVMKAAKTPESRGRAAVTMNSLVRNAKALLSKKVRPFIEQEMQLPSPLFFEGVSAEPEPSLRYRSKIDAESILRAAQSELASQDTEAFKLLLLTLVCGLRRSEADTLMWSQFDFSKRLLVIEDTEHKRLKSKDSAGDIDLEPELCALFQGYMAKAKSPFVLEPSKRIRIASMQERETRGYRSEPTHRSLLAWLRRQGVNGIRPMHTLRKEIGAVIASRDGIWKASRYLRHSDIRITSKLYADKKFPVTSGLGALLKPASEDIFLIDFKLRNTDK
jgi:integrase